MASTIKLNYDRKALASGINYSCKHDATIWNVALMSSFMIVICLYYRPLMKSTAPRYNPFITGIHWSQSTWLNTPFLSS